MIHAPEAKQAGTQRNERFLTVAGPHRDAVLEQLDRLLASDIFSGSKRASGLLRYIVWQTLDNGGAELKERTIGVQVFGRSLNYDTSTEPVVRVAAGDLRKRIAQYYYESGRENEIRIDLPIGSYHPVFQLPNTTPPVAPAASREVAVTAAKTSGFSYLVAAVVALVGVGILAAVRMPGSAYDQFWGPVVAEEGSALIYAGGRAGDNRMVVEDAIALSDLSGELRVRNKAYRILTEGELTPETLKRGPSLLIGGFSNPLARRLTQQLRFTFASEGDLATTGFAFIQDRQNLNSRDWSAVRGPLGDAPTFTDYGIISRVVDPATDRIAVTSAGIRRYGTLAAAEFLSHREQMEAVRANAPRDWRKKNMQAVLAIGVKRGKAEPARVVATYFW